MLEIRDRFWPGTSWASTADDGFFQGFWIG
jgi:hypothetical protein